MTRRQWMIGLTLVVGPLLVAAAAAPASPVNGGAVLAVASDAALPPTEHEVRIATARSMVSAMTTREKVASVVMGHVPSSDPAEVSEYMSATGVGGFILMGANIGASAAEVRALTTALIADPSLPPLIAIDQEGGDVSRLDADTAASALTLASADAATVEAAFVQRGAIVADAGVSVNFGVVADWTADPNSFISRRVLGTSPGVAAEHVASAVRGESAFVASTLKHFPGHGAAPGDSHRTIPETDMSRQQWDDSESLPFIAGIDAGAPLVMFGHLVYSSVDPAPASLSAEWHRILRDDVGFDGVSVTDDMGMLEASGLAEYQDPGENAVNALLAGNDLVLGVTYSSIDRANAVIDAVAVAVDSGRIPVERIDDAATRVLALRLSVPASAVPCAECAPAE